MSDSSPADVIVTGHLCLDLHPDMAQVPLQALNMPGSLAECGPLGLSGGGAVPNVGLSLHRLGVNVRLMAAVGDDLIGHAIIDLLNARSPELTRSIAVRPGEQSSYSIVLAPLRSDRIFLHFPGNNTTFGLPDIDFDIVAQAKHFHLGYPTILPRLMASDGAEMAEIFRRAKATSVTTSLDMTLPDPLSPSGRADWRAILRSALPYVDVFVPSIEEILFMLRRADFDAWRGKVLEHIDAAYLSDLAAELLDMGAAVAGFKLGESGMFLQTGPLDRFAAFGRSPIRTDEWANQQLWHPAFQVSVEGTTGAGDSAYAGLITALLRGLSPEDAIRHACAVGACNVETADSSAGVRSWDETTTRIRAGWSTRVDILRGYNKP
jgi:sugar/nucleoside kinase (ribokinase family)